MPQELIYTSAESGLKAGSRGFCTVGATDGMPPRTVTLLESLSGYRHTHSPTQQPHPGNPVNWSHLHTEAGDSLLSRIADAGLDYSGRSNKIAHHVLLSSSQRAMTGPAAMAAAAGNLVETWNHAPMRIPNRSLAEGTVPSLPARAWQSVSGDAGWAGVLAATATDPAKPTAYLIFEASQNVFLLIQEAMALLSPETRWRITFSTLFMGVPPGMSCQWRCVLAGSREHASVPPHNRVLRIDLTSPLGAAPEGTLVHLARTGINLLAPSEANPQRTSRSASLSAAHVPPVLPLESPENWQQPPQLQASLPPLIVPEPTGHTYPPNRVPLWIAMGMIVCMLLATAGWFLYQAGRVSSIADAQPVNEPSIEPADAIERNDFDSVEVSVEDAEATPHQPFDAESENMAEPLTDLKPVSAPEKMSEVEASPDQLSDPALTSEKPTAISRDPLAPVPQSVAKTEPAEATPVEIHYLLEPATWTVFSNPKSGWAGDRERLVVKASLPIPEAVVGLELIAENQMKKVSNIVYQRDSGQLQLNAGDDPLTGGSIPIATFQTNQVILQPNFARRIGDRFLLAKIGNTYHLLTLHGAVTPKHGMDQPLELQLTPSKPIARSLGAISPALLTTARLQLASPPPDGWTLRASERKLLLVNSEDNEIEIRLDIGTALPLHVTYRTNETRATVHRLEFVIGNDLLIESKRFFVTLSRFNIEIP